MLPDHLPHLCDIKTSYTLPDELSGDVDDPTVADEDVACWIQPASDNEINRFKRRDQNVTHRVYFKGNPGVKPGYILRPKDGRITCPFAGAWLEVKSSAETTAGLGLLWSVMCEELQPR